MTVQSPTRVRHWTSPIKTVLAAIGALSIALFSLGLFLDSQSFDRTSGGYTVPYTDFTGTPVDWKQADRTSTGFAGRGYIVNFLADCTTGMVSFQIFGQKLDWRTFSPRALVVHKPREACTEAGFQPQF
jgi:hypothetical protein